jgi:predicted AAA+ superfamily ATPase
LKKYIERIKKTKNKKVIFFDELPWLDSRRSGFLGAFEHFWNSWASKRTDIIVVICGSAASWMISKIVNNKGGLHNRITKKIRLLPFTLHEMELYLQSRRVQLDKYQLLQLYMAMGGIPHYLKENKTWAKCRPEY